MPVYAIMGERSGVYGTGSKVHTCFVITSASPVKGMLAPLGQTRKTAHVDFKATAMKICDGFSQTVPSIITGVAAFISFWLLAMAMKDLPFSTAYVVWVGIGAIGASLLGIMMFADAVTPMRVEGITLVAAGIVTLKLA